MPPPIQDASEQVLDVDIQDEEAQRSGSLARQLHAAKQSEVSKSYSCSSPVGHAGTAGYVVSRALRLLSRSTRTKARALELPDDVVVCASTTLPLHAPQRHKVRCQLTRTHNEQPCARAQLTRTLTGSSRPTSLFRSVSTFSRCPKLQLDQLSRRPAHPPQAVAVGQRELLVARMGAMTSCTYLARGDDRACGKARRGRVSTWTGPGVVLRLDVDVLEVLELQINSHDDLPIHHEQQEVSKGCWPRARQLGIATGGRASQHMSSGARRRYRRGWAGAGEARGRATREYLGMESVLSARELRAGRSA